MPSDAEAVLHDTTNMTPDDVFKDEHKQLSRVNSSLETFRFAEVKPLTKDQLTRLIYDSLHSESLLKSQSRPDSPSLFSVPPSEAGTDMHDADPWQRPITREELKRVIQETMQEAAGWSQPNTDGMDVMSVGFAESEVGSVC
ncbi:hypothetical protein HDV00_000198 [Rhizophlyctis rosea]|nr:hypothetical protein HDV00_000198 [Rhizophlyctis rosea]